MLSKDTVEFLNIACEKSNQKYYQGGLIYLYTYGHRRAHSFVDYEVLKTVDGIRYFNVEEIRKIKLLFASALDNPYPENIRADTIKFTEDLISMLYNNFENTHAFVNEYEEGETSKRITLTFLRDNDFHSLELFWSID